MKACAARRSVPEKSPTNDPASPVSPKLLTSVPPFERAEMRNVNTRTITTVACLVLRIGNFLWILTWPQIELRAFDEKGVSGTGSMVVELPLDLIACIVLSLSRLIA